MKKVFVCLISILTAIGAWGANQETDQYKWKESTKTLTIKASGYENGVMTDYSTTSTAPWYSHRNDVQKIIVEDGITHIGAQAFYSLGTQSVDITLPASLTSIGEKAFYSSSNTKVANIYFKGTPAQWASIDFQGSSLQYYAHPFGKSNAANRKLFFYGITTSVPSTVYIEPTITEIKQYAFYNVNSFTTVCIPGTITNIRKSAFQKCSALNTIIINCATAPGVGTEGLSEIAGTVNLYVPSTNSGYNNAPWSGYSKTTCNTSGENYIVDETTLNWGLDANGVLTINAISGTKALNFDLSGNGHPWGMFRRIIYKVKIQGEITAIGSLLRYHCGLSEVIVDQNIIPTCTGKIGILNSGDASYTGLFNKRDNLKLSIRPASLADASASNLGSAPWSEDKWDIELSEDVAISDNADNTTLLANINTYVEKPFTMNLNRSLSNAYYNTFCSPIAISAAKIAEIWGATGLYALSTTAGSGDENEIVMNFDDATDIAAGVPYLIKPTNGAVTSFTISDIEPNSVASSPSSVSNGDITFYGTLAPRAVTEEEVTSKNFIILTSTMQDGAQLLDYANGGTLGGMRAYWKLNDSQAAASQRPVIRISGEEQGIGEVRSENANAVRSEKIMRNGQIYIVRDGQEYTILGQKK